MTWHLKDRTLEEALMKIDSGFVTLLNNKYEFMKKQYGEDFSGFRVEFGKRVEPDIFQCSILVRTSEIEDIPSYNPNTWNEFPKVTPPEGVWMRFDTPLSEGFKAIFKYGKWFDCYDDKIDRSHGRFRPWEY